MGRNPIPPAPKRLTIVERVQQAYVEGAIDFFEFDYAIEQAVGGRAIDAESCPGIVSYLVDELFFGPGAVIPVNPGESIKYVAPSGQFVQIYRNSYDPK